MKKLLTSLFLGFTLVITGFATLIESALAQPPGYYPSENYNRYQARQAPVQRQKSPVDLLEESINKVIVFVSQPQPRTAEEITRFLNAEITPHFDFQYMSQWVAGRYYRQMDKQQQVEFTNTFTNLFVTTFVQKLTAFQAYPPVVEAFASKRTGSNEALASAEVIQENGRKLDVDFRFIRTKNGWKVIDVKANDISALFHYRNYFAQQMYSKQQRNTASR